MNLNYYNKTKYNSEIFEKCNRLNDTFLIRKDIFSENKSEPKWVIKLDIAILSIICSFFIPLCFNTFYVLDNLDCEENNCIDKEFCWICNCIGGCFCSLYECFSCCSLDEFCCCCLFSKCCSCCCGNDYESLKEENNNLKKKIKELKTKNELL